VSTLRDESRPLLGVRTAADSVPEIRFGEAGREAGRAAERAEPNYRAIAALWVAGATIVRFASVASLPLGNGEAYYFTWSRFLDWSYYDHPPLVAWMVRLTTLLSTSSAAVRLGPILCAGLFGLLFYRLAERLFTPRAAFFALVLVTAIPVFVMSSLVLNPEAPLAPLWVAFLLVLEGMREKDEAFRPLLLGVVLGFAFLAKYTAVLLVPTALLYLALSAPSRRWLRRPSLYAGGFVALLITLPVLLWNHARNWPTLHLHLVERAGVGVPVAGENTVNHLVEIASTPGFTGLETVVRLLIGQAMMYSPLIAPVLVVALFRLLRHARKDDRQLFLASFSWPVLALLLAAMMRLKDAEQHWTMMGFVPAVIAAGHYADLAWSRVGESRFVRYPILAASGAALSGILFIVAVAHFHTNAVLRFIPASHYDARADMTNELAGWDQVSASVARVAGNVHGPTVLTSNHYAMCGRLFYEMGDSPHVYCPTARRTAFDFFGRHDVPANATVIAVTNDIHDELPVGLEDRTCTLDDTVDIERAGRNVARYFVRTCPPAWTYSEKRASRD
jgi:4-amino-4-deoxy-L-arabinose transferase-like glycosyltransferase